MSDRFKLNKARNSAWPNQCTVCGNAEVDLVDWGNSDRDGAILMCVSCFLSAMDLFPDKVVDRKLYDLVATQLEQANARRNSLHTALSNFQFGFAQLTSTFVDELEHVPDDEPEETGALTGFELLELDPVLNAATSKSSG